MGMAASQARYLALVARKSNCEYEGQQINQQRTTLANQSANLFNQMLGLSVPVPPSTSDFTTTQYSYTDGTNSSVIEKWEQLSKPESDYNYVVTHSYNVDRYTGSVKKMSDPQAQITGTVYTQGTQQSIVFSQYSAVLQAKAAMEAAEEANATAQKELENLEEKLQQEDPTIQAAYEAWVNAPSAHTQAITTAMKSSATAQVKLAELNSSNYATNIQNATGSYGSLSSVKQNWSNSTGSDIDNVTQDNASYAHAVTNLRTSVTNLTDDVDTKITNASAAISSYTTTGLASDVKTPISNINDAFQSNSVVDNVQTELNDLYNAKKDVSNYSDPSYTNVKTSNYQSGSPGTCDVTYTSGGTTTTVSYSQYTGYGTTQGVPAFDTQLDTLATSLGYTNGQDLIRKWGPIYVDNITNPTTFILDKETGSVGQSKSVSMFNTTGTNSTSAIASEFTTALTAYNMTTGNISDCDDYQAITTTQTNIKNLNTDVSDIDEDSTASELAGIEEDMADACTDYISSQSIVTNVLARTDADPNNYSSSMLQNLVGAVYNAYGDLNTQAYKYSDSDFTNALTKLHNNLTTNVNNVSGLEAYKNEITATGIEGAVDTLYTAVTTGDIPDNFQEILDNTANAINMLSQISTGTSSAAEITAKITDFVSNDKNDIMTDLSGVNIDTSDITGLQGAISRLTNAQTQLASYSDQDAIITDNTLGHGSSNYWIDYTDNGTPTRSNFMSYTYGGGNTALDSALDDLVTTLGYADVNALIAAKGPVYTTTNAANEDIFVFGNEDGSNHALNIYNATDTNKSATHISDCFDNAISYYTGPDVVTTLNNANYYLTESITDVGSINNSSIKSDVATANTSLSNFNSFYSSAVSDVYNMALNPAYTTGVAAIDTIITNGTTGIDDYLRDINNDLQGSTSQADINSDANTVSNLLSELNNIDDEAVLDSRPNEDYTDQEKEDLATLQTAISDYADEISNLDTASVNTAVSKLSTPKYAQNIYPTTAVVDTWHLNGTQVEFGSGTPAWIVGSEDSAHNITTNAYSALPSEIQSFIDTLEDSVKTQITSASGNKGVIYKQNSGGDYDIIITDRNITWSDVADTYQTYQVYNTNTASSYVQNIENGKSQITTDNNTAQTKYSNLADASTGSIVSLQNLSNVTSNSSNTGLIDIASDFGETYSEYTEAQTTYLTTINSPEYDDHYEETCEAAYQTALNSNSEYIAASLTATTAAAAYQVAKQNYENELSTYNDLRHFNYIGNCELTPLAEDEQSFTDPVTQQTYNIYSLTEDQETELKQIVKDMQANGYDVNINDCFDSYGNYTGGIYEFTMNGVKYYTTYNDLDESYPADQGNNYIDEQIKLAYYTTGYVSTKVSETEKALLETDGNGRFSSVRFENDSTVYTLNVESATDEDAYNDAMNEYYYENAVYDKTVQDINAKTSLIQQQDLQLELRLKQLDTEQNALKTEMDAVKKVVDDNVEKSFKTFSG